ncbi:MAG: SDR family oxidoreductase [Verrucomicrobia bacterium]|nr:SDR family oxidoreductase [Verrucomicrobiota bacterium]
MRVLIVGCGYVGLPLAVELVRLGHQVSGLRRSASDALRATGITPLSGDITRPETLRDLPNNFDWVVNCAATGGGTVEDYRQLYLEGTRNLIEWLVPGSAGILPAGSKDNQTATRRQDGSAPRFVYTSSTGVYGQNDGSLVDETSATEPASETAQILVATEKLLLQLARERNIPAMILRAAGIYGPERGYLLKQFLRGDARIEGAGARVLNMIHRDDLIASIIAALERGYGGEIYNVVDDEPVSQLEFFRWLASTLDKPMPPIVPEDTAAPRKRGLTNKRISNRKLRMELGVDLKFPDYRSGYTNEIQRLAQV